MLATDKRLALTTLALAPSATSAGGAAATVVDPTMSDRPVIAIAVARDCECSLGE